MALLKERLEPGKHDGFLTFSQGGFIAKHFFHLNPKLGFCSHTPSFYMGFSTGHFPLQVYEFKGENYASKDYKIDVPALWYIGKKDPIYTEGTSEKLAFTNLTLVLHEEGHDVPKVIEKEQMDALVDFIKK